MFVWNCILTPLMCLGDLAKWGAESTYPNFVIFFFTFVLTVMTGITWLLG